MSIFKEYGEAYAGAWAVARLAAGDSRNFRNFRCNDKHMKACVEECRKFENASRSMMKYLAGK